jgi:hypothetical protein
MLTVKDVRALDEKEQAQLDKLSEILEQRVHQSFEKNPKTESFEFDRQALVKEIGGLSAKVREEALRQLDKGGWKVELTDTKLVLSFRKRGGPRGPRKNKAGKANAKANAKAGK